VNKRVRKKKLKQGMAVIEKQFGMIIHKKSLQIKHIMNATRDNSSLQIKHIMNATRDNSPNYKASWTRTLIVD